MSQIRSKNTKPELLLKDLIKEILPWNIYRYYNYKNLKGKPDIYIPRLRIVIFLHGCFWHKCPIHFVQPKSNIDYWIPKIERNVERDNTNEHELSNKGLKVIKIWEHEVKRGNLKRLKLKINNIIRDIIEKLED